MTQTNPLVDTWREQGPVLWAQGAYGWIGEDRKPVTLEPWQATALGAWWDNRETCSTWAVSNVKKTGKTFTNAVLLCWRWLALPGLHFAIGNDLDQAQARQFSEIAEMVKRHPYLSTVCRVTKNSLLFEPTGSTLTALAVDAAGNAGANHLTASHTEAWGIIYEAGIRAYEELTPPPGRKYGLPALRIIDSYAGFEGESKTWHNLVDRGQEGEKISADWPIYRSGGLVLFHMAGAEARERCFRGTPADAARYYQDQGQELRPNAFTRMHSNERTAAESAFLPEGAWKACLAPDVKALQPGERIRLVFGADASTSRDFTALVGVVFDGVYTDVRYCRVWKPQRIAGIRLGKPTIDIDETLGAELFRLHEAGHVAAVVCDNYQLHTLVVAMQKKHIKVIELAQNLGRVESDQSLYDLVVSRAIRHYGDPALDEAMGNAIAQETVRGLRLAKEKASKKIDAAVALSMAAWGAHERGVIFQSQEMSWEAEQALALWLTGGAVPMPGISDEQELAMADYERRKKQEQDDQARLAWIMSGGAEADRARATARKIIRDLKPKRSEQ